MTPTTPVRRELLLAGGGHAHLGVLRDLVRHGVPPGLRVTLLAREAAAIYSGMLPGLIAGRFTVDDCLVDLPRLVRAAGARFIRAEACGLDRDAQHLLLAGDRPPMRYDLLSLNLGAEPVLVPGAAEHALPLRPFGRFLPRWRRCWPRWPRLRGRCACWWWAPARRGGSGPGPAPAARATRRDRAARDRGGAAEQLARRAPAGASRAHPGGHRPAWGRRRASSRVRFSAPRAEAGIRRGALGHRRRAGPWFRDAGLALCPRGFLAVDATLRSIGDARVFAAGDCATVLEHPRERAGVFAVRQGPPLAANLRRVLAGEPLGPSGRSGATWRW
ncbi:hypothetical protein ACFQU2_16745 [Siccirubricoccus deserti]